MCGWKRKKEKKKKKITGDEIGEEPHIEPSPFLWLQNKTKNNQG